MDSPRVKKSTKDCFLKSIKRRGTFVRAIAHKGYKIVKRWIFGVNAALTRHFDRFQLFFRGWSFHVDSVN
jgi:hypothetical protein